ncbi:MAG: TetR-like C-terminal domain-containing protein [Aristaeellaceae bacterium]
MKKENQRVALTRRLLKESLLRLLADKDIQAITVTELCAEAQINRCTFYKHYGCTEDVLEDIERSVVADLEALWLCNGPQKDWTLNRRVAALCHYLREHAALMKLLCRNSDTDSGFANKVLNAAHVRALYELELSCVSDPESRQLFITFLANGTYHMVRQWLLEDSPKTPEEMGELVYRIATRGWENAFAPQS